MPQIEDYCAGCQKQITIDIGQTIINSNLKWYSSYKCPFCGTAVEMDDFGFPPNEIRQIILLNEKEWSLLVNESELKNKSTLLKILRQSLGLSISESAKFLKNLPNLTSGTRTEMEWLKQLLLAEGIISKVEEKA